jgi:hypothetical protein
MTDPSKTGVGSTYWLLRTRSSNSVLVKSSPTGLRPSPWSTGRNRNGYADPLRFVDNEWCSTVCAKLRSWNAISCNKSIFVGRIVFEKFVPKVGVDV